MTIAHARVCADVKKRKFINRCHIHSRIVWYIYYNKYVHTKVTRSRNNFHASLKFPQTISTPKLHVCFDKHAGLGGKNVIFSYLRFSGLGFWMVSDLRPSVASSSTLRLILHIFRSWCFCFQYFHFDFTDNVVSVPQILIFFQYFLYFYFFIIEIGQCTFISTFRAFGHWQSYAPIIYMVKMH